MKVSVRYRQEGASFSMWLVDEEGNALEDEQVFEAFNNFQLEGAYVKRNPRAFDFPDEMPPVGLIITGYTKDRVVLKKDLLGEFDRKGDYLVPKRKFHQWFILD